MRMIFQPQAEIPVSMMATSPRIFSRIFSRRRWLCRSGHGCWPSNVWATASEHGLRAQVVRQHRCPRDGLQRGPMRASREDQRGNHQPLAKACQHGGKLGCRRKSASRFAAPQSFPVPRAEWARGQLLFRRRKNSTRSTLLRRQGLQTQTQRHRRERLRRTEQTRAAEIVRLQINWLTSILYPPALSSFSQRPPAKPEAWQRWSGPRPLGPAGGNGRLHPVPRSLVRVRQ